VREAVQRTRRGTRVLRLGVDYVVRKEEDRKIREGGWWSRKDSIRPRRPIGQCAPSPRCRRGAAYTPTARAFPKKRRRHIGGGAAGRAEREDRFPAASRDEGGQEGARAVTATARGKHTREEEIDDISGYTPRLGFEHRAPQGCAAGRRRIAFEGGSGQATAAPARDQGKGNASPRSRLEGSAGRSPAPTRALGRTRGRWLVEIADRPPRSCSGIERYTSCSTAADEGPSARRRAPFGPQSMRGFARL